jgi:hypothetical protein
LLDLIFWWWGDRPVQWSLAMIFGDRLTLAQGS